MANGLSSNGHFYFPLKRNNRNPLIMETKKPLKRIEELRFLSREHHHGLLLCWKIRSGFAKQIDVSRIKTYVDWFYNNHIQQHFNIEENHIFPILGNGHKLVKKALSEHKRLHKLFNDEHNVQNALSLLEEELEQHIRFEERVLFKEIQNIATEKQLKLIAEIHTDEKFIDNTEDEFWK